MVVATFGTFLWVAAVTAVVEPAGLPAPSPQLTGTLEEGARIFARNTTVCLLVIALAHVAPRAPAFARGLLVGAAAAVPLGPALLGGMLAGQDPSYFPHAPAELYALALAAGWPAQHARTGAPSLGATARRTAIVAALLLAAAALEVLAVPHAG